MRLEHTKIRSYMRESRERFAAPTFAADVLQNVRDLLQAVENILNEHNEKEETIYYPLCDRLLSSDEAAQVLDQIRKVT
jgi:hemerythrin-like domain-containing protein